MKKILLSALILILGIAPAHAMSPYISAGGSLGFSLSGDNARSGGFSGAAGLRYTVANIPMRTEFEYSNLIYRKTYHFDTGAGRDSLDYDLKTQMYLVNVLANLKIPMMRSGFHIGLSAGALTYRRDMPDSLGGDTGTQTTFIYGATAGVALNLIGGLYGDIGVRYLRTLDDDVVDNLTPYFNLSYGF